MASAPAAVESDSVRWSRWSRGRWALILLTILWLPSGVVALLMLAGLWPAGPAAATTRALLWLAVGVHTSVVVAGWAVIGWREWARRRAAPSPEAGKEPRPPVTLGDLLALSPAEFEERVKQLFEDRGYYAINTPDTADHGIDLLLVDPMGMKAVVQCKRYAYTVGEGAIRDLYGTVLHEAASLGYLVTTAGISQAARRWAQGKPLELIDGDRLVRLANARPQDLAFEG